VKKILVVLTTLLMTACGEEVTTPAETPSANQPPAKVAATTDKVLEVYKSPTCGCCGAWVEHMEANGYTANVHEQQNLQSIKEKAGILPGTGSCHTAFIDGYAIEGHVRASDVDQASPFPACPQAPPAWKWATAKTPTTCCCSMKTAPRSSAIIPGIKAQWRVTSGESQNQLSKLVTRHSHPGNASTCHGNPLKCRLCA